MSISQLAEPFKVVYDVSNTHETEYYYRLTSSVAKDNSWIEGPVQIPARPLADTMFPHLKQGRQ